MARLRSLVPFIPVAALVAVIGGNATANAGITADVLLSQAKPVLTSSVEDSTLTGDKAVDGNTSTRWASLEYVDPQWIRVDLGAPATISRVNLNWEVAYAADYRIEVSLDGSTYSTVKQVTGGNGAIDDHTGLNARGRYVRVYGTKRGTAWGYSLWEMQVYGTSDSTGDTQAPTVPTGLASTGVTGSTTSLRWNASNDNVGVAGYDVLRNGVVVATVSGTTHTDTGLTANTAYSYAVRARDLAGNVSDPSTALSVTTSSGGGTLVVAAAGDIADQCTASSSSCVHPKTARLVQTMNPVNVITMGDNQYDDAHYSDFTNYFAKTWGAFKSIMKPATGNHETYASPPYDGYDRYFGSIAKPNGKRYYSWERGNWHFISVDSTTFSPGLASSEQLNWIKQDLANNTKSCVAVYYHHPRFSSGSHGDNPNMEELWNTLVQAKVDLVLNGHDHHYERFAPQDENGSRDPAGPVQIIGGTGGKDLYTPSGEHPATDKILKTHGVLKLTLTDNTFQSQLIGLNSSVLDSSPTYTCH